MFPVFIYALLDPRTGETRYVGQTVDPDRRLRGHIRNAKKENWHVCRWVNSLFVNGLKPVMEIIDVVPDNEADFWETEYLQNFRERGFDLTNDTIVGGAPMRGKKHSAETRAKMSTAHAGRKHTPEARARMSLAQKGRTFSPEARAKMSASRMGSKNHFGKKHSPESRAKMGCRGKDHPCYGKKVWNSGKKISLAHRAAISAGQLGKKRGPYKKKNVVLN